jgi:hypothetical protein
VTARVRWTVAVGLVAAGCILAGAATRTAPALADTDPASDVLLYQRVYFPFRAAPRAVEHRLSVLVRTANDRGYRIRLAVVQSRRDLGAVSTLYGRPEAYARLLSSELDGGWRDRVLVVMPSGYGLAHAVRVVRAGGVNMVRAPATTAPDATVLRQLAAPAGGSPEALVNAAARAVRALAAANDVKLVTSPTLRPGSPGGGSSGRSHAVAAAVAAAVGLTAGLLWYLWRTRPRRPDADANR